MGKKNNFKTLSAWIQVALIGFCALALGEQTRFLLHLSPLSWQMQVLLYAATLFGYNWFAQNNLMRASAWLLGLCAGLVWLQLPVSQQIACSGPGILWVLYFGLHTTQSKGLRGKAWLKPICVALTWAWVTVWLVLPADQWLITVPVLIERAALVFVLTLGYDLHDRALDEGLGLDTLVLRYGMRGTFRLMDAGWLLSGTMAVLSGALHNYTWLFTGFIVLHLLIARYLLRLLSTSGRLLPWHKTMIDAMMPMQTLFIVIGYWIFGA